ncbi:MAG: protein-glutamate O-methyltransferase [Rhizomicrobium sp.]
MATIPHSREISPVPDGEFAFTWSDFRQIAAVVHSESGIVLADTKVNLVYSRLAKRLRLIGLRTFHDYCALIQSADGADERQAMIAAMTTNVTRFFREPHHFEYLARAIVPSMIAAARHGERVRLWSAGCSSGEEPYSIALTLLAAMPDIDDYDVLVLATDIDPNMLRRGECGEYTAAQIDGVPSHLLGKWFDTQKKEGEVVYSVVQRLRNLVRFKELNLLGNWPMKGQFEVIFCRNVMIYFDEPTQNEIWQRFATMLRPMGHLFIGHSERIATDRQSFDLLAQTTYRVRRGRNA